MRSRLGIVLVVGLLLGFVTSCGNEPERLTAKTLFPQMSKAQAKAGSSTISMTLTTPGGEKFKSQGQMKLGRQPEDTAMAMTVSGDTGGLGNVELRLVDRAFYISLGALTQNKFAKIDLTDKSNPIARQYGDIIENVDPARQVRQYQDAITKFDSSGEAIELDGVKAQPYAITIDPSKAKQLKGIDRASLPDSIDFTLYVGPDDLPRRMVSLMPVQDGSTTKLQMDYSKWGEKVTVTAPSKARITEDSVLNRLGQLDGSPGAAPTP
ncbi:MAG TPA: hypothetical protein VJL80_02530 [Aeromicrobium sp.]|nr:hypothetical protein [Aeromicrobium sp.]HKY56897.1 hypothetical protein [Aeromicrobium sp.]